MAKCANCGVEGHRELTGITGVEYDNIYTKGETIIWFKSSYGEGYCDKCLSEKTK